MPVSAACCCPSLLQGLDYLHSKRLVHFDLKSANLLVTMRDKVPCVKLADMGREWTTAAAAAADAVVKQQRWQQHTYCLVMRFA
jgi:serine/threonine protein kinase